MGFKESKEFNWPKATLYSFLGVIFSSILFVFLFHKDDPYHFAFTPLFTFYLISFIGLGISSMPICIRCLKLVGRKTKSKIISAFGIIIGLVVCGFMIYNCTLTGNMAYWSAKFVYGVVLGRNVDDAEFYHWMRARYKVGRFMKDGSYTRTVYWKNEWQFRDEFEKDREP